MNANYCRSPRFVDGYKLVNLGVSTRMIFGV
jgi:hypothetical protein